LDVRWSGVFHFIIDGCDGSSFFSFSFFFLSTRLTVSKSSKSGLRCLACHRRGTDLVEQGEVFGVEGEAVAGEHVLDGDVVD
jgi:hypothetical protein